LGSVFKQTARALVGGGRFFFGAAFLLAPSPILRIWWPDDREDLSAALGLLLGDSTLRARMSAAASRRASRLPRWEDTVSGLEQVLSTAAETRKSGPM
jgi:hypothetical protein